MRRMLEKTHAEPRRRGGEERESYALENAEQIVGIEQEAHDSTWPTDRSLLARKLKKLIETFDILGPATKRSAQAFDGLRTTSDFLHRLYDHRHSCPSGRPGSRVNRIVRPCTTPSKTPVMFDTKKTSTKSNDWID